MLKIILFFIAAYLMGSLSSAVVVSRFLGLPDPRTKGSKNPGATNVLRVGGKNAAIIVLVMDVLKGFIPVFIGKMVGFYPMTLAWIGLAAVLGHLYPVFFQFKGGKGVATAFGALFALSLPVGITLIIIWSITAFIFRYVSLASVVAALFAPIFSAFFVNFFTILPIGIMSFLVITRHHQNIKNIIKGREDRIKKIYK